MVEDGIFWLPGTPDAAVRGRLSYGEEDAPTVELVDALTPALRVVSTSTNEDGTVVSELEPTDDEENFIVHGLLRSSPRSITLLDCLTTSRRSVAGGPGFEDQVIRARYAVRGAHVSGDDQAYSAIKVRVKGVENWVSLAGFSGSIGSADEVALTYRRPQPVDAQTGSAARIRVSESLRRSSPRPTGGYIHREVWLAVDNFGELTYSEMSSRYISPIVNVINLTMGRPAPVTGIRVKAAGNDEWCSIWHSRIANDDNDESAPTRSNHILTLGNLGLACVAQFVDLTPKIGHIAPVVADSAALLRKATLETQVLELTTVAEGLHRALYGNANGRFSKAEATEIRKLVRGALKEKPTRFNEVAQGFLRHVEEPNYKSRLRHLASVAETLIPDVVGDVEEWVKIVDRARNLFAHRVQHQIDSDTIDRYYAISQSLRWLLTAVLLCESGIDRDVCSSAICESSQYRQYRRNMKSALPNVFRDGESGPVSSSGSVT